MIETIAYFFLNHFAMFVAAYWFIHLVVVMPTFYFCGKLYHKIFGYTIPYQPGVGTIFRSLGLSLLLALPIGYIGFSELFLK